MEKNLTWCNAETLAVGGKGWMDTKRFFDRLPAKAEGMIRGEVWDLSRQSAGIRVGFRTNSPTLGLRWILLLEQLIRPMMCGIGASGLDLYCRDETGRWRWVMVGHPTQRDNEALPISNIPAKPRDYLLYLPLRNGVEILEIGITPDSSLEAKPAFTGKPIVYYGTSIVHGEGASRPGMCHAAILGRRLDVPVINLGFAGAGTLDLPIAELMAELDARLYIVDCLPNLLAPQVTERCEPFIRQLRAARPNTPIMLVEDRTSPGAWLNGMDRHIAGRKALREAYDRLRVGGVPNLFYMTGDGLLGDDDEATVDSSHPSDLGYVRYADAMEPVIRSILREQKP